MVPSYNTERMVHNMNTKQCKYFPLKKPQNGMNKELAKFIQVLSLSQITRGEWVQLLYSNWWLNLERDAKRNVTFTYKYKETQTTV